MVQYSENLIPAMTSNTAPSGVVQSSNDRESAYQGWRVFDKAIGGAASSWATADGITSAWVSYSFPVSKRVEMYSIRTYGQSYSPKSWTFEGSNDGSNWTVLDTRTNETVWGTSIRKTFTFTNNNSYLRYRLNISSVNSLNYIIIEEVEMFEVIIQNKILLSSGDKYYGSTEYVYTENLIPQLTSDTSTVGTAIASSVNSATYAAWKAFDRDISTRWASNVTSASYVGFAFLEPKKINKYTIACNAQKSLDWTFDGYSEISSTWVTLHQVTGITWSNDAEIKEFVFSNENFYKQYRINTTRTSIAGPSISSIEMMEQKSAVVSIIETVSLDESTILKYGSTHLPFNSTSERKRHIQLNNKSYNSGKTYQHSIDLSKRRVDKITLG